MKKTWEVKIDEQMHKVELNNQKLVVDGEKLKLRKFKKKSGLIHEEYEIPVGPKNALLVLKNMSAPQLVIDGLDCATGEEYVPVKLPKWAYVFIVLHFVNFLNGALGCCIAIIGISATSAVCFNQKMNTVMKIVLSIAILALALILTFGLALVVASM